MKSLSEVDDLFALPLAEFTAARNTLAARLKKEGLLEESKRVKALSKPSATAWAVNQLYWRHRSDFDRLRTANEKVGDAQMGRSGDLRSLLEERRTMISALASLAEELLSGAGNAGSTDARRRVITTLESLTARDGSGVELQAGRLTEDLQPLGFDSLAEMFQGGPPAKANVLDFQQGAKEKQLAKETQKVEAERAARARAEAIELAETALANARREAEQAQKRAAAVAARRDTLEHERQELELRLAAAAKEARSAIDAVESSARALADAERALTRVRGA